MALLLPSAVVLFPLASSSSFTAICSFISSAVYFLEPGSSGSMEYHLRPWTLVAAAGRHAREVRAGAARAVVKLREPARATVGAARSRELLSSRRGAAIVVCGAMRDRCSTGFCGAFGIVVLREMTFRWCSPDGSSRAPRPTLPRAAGPGGTDGPSGAVVLVLQRTAHLAQHSTAQDGPASSPNQDF